jgi:Cu2+-exporting ATPase
MGAAGAVACFHCGEPVAPGTSFTAVVNGAERAMCCAGCAAVARTIAGMGLAVFYDRRSALPPREAAARESDFADYDLAEIQRPFVRQAGRGLRQATLLVEDVTCGACGWLIERAVLRLDGVRSVAVNVAAHRAQVEWDEGQVKLSAILRAIAALGYRTRGFDPVAGAGAVAQERRAMLWRLFVAGLAMMQVMMYAAPAYVTDGELTREAGNLMRWAGLVLTVPVMIWSAGPFFANAGRDLKALRVGMDVPVSLGLAAAFGASAWNTVSGSGDVYFDSIAMLVFLLLGGRFLETIARERATESQRRLAGHVPAAADRLVSGAAPGVTERVAAGRLVPGDLVQVAPGGVIPADGRLISGSSAADESLLTGEARPVPKRPGDALTGGSINLAHPVIVEVTRVGPETVLAGVLRLIDRAQAGRPRVAQLADRVAQWFVAALLLVAAGAGTAWSMIEPARALEVVVAVLVVSCPCALSLATPTALAAATAALHRAGVLVVREHALESLARVTHIVLDKTGTLTVGRLAMVGVAPLSSLSRTACLALAAALERGSGHPVARTILAAAGESDEVRAADTRNFPGQGVEAVVAGKRYRIGTASFAAGLARRPLPGALALAGDDVSVAVLAGEKGYLALFTLGDTPRTGARSVVRDLEARGTKACLLSGDRGPVVAHIARQLGISVAVGDADPQMKLAFVREMQSAGPVVAMVGDGTNDAPVMAQAEVAIAMGSATDVVLKSADVVLPRNDLACLGPALDVARRTMRVIRQNFAWAAGYNAVALPLAVAGWITPLAAGIGMAASSLVVVLNALRLLPVAENRS